MPTAAARRTEECVVEESHEPSRQGPPRWAASVGQALPWTISTSLAVHNPDLPISSLQGCFYGRSELQCPFLIDLKQSALLEEDQPPSGDPATIRE